MVNFTQLTPEKYDEIKQAAIDWQYLVVVNHGMARKSDCEAWLMPRYGIDHYTARQITNDITSGDRYFLCGRDGVQWNQYVANRRAPTLEDYPDFVMPED